MKGSILLKILGVLLVIGGVFTTISGLIGFSAMKDSGDAINILGSTDIAKFKTVIFISMIGGIVQAISGILCIINSKKPEKSMILFICAIAILALSTIGNLVAMSMGMSNKLSLVYGIIVPGLVILGAYLNKK